LAKTSPRHKNEKRRKKREKREESTNYANEYELKKKSLPRRYMEVRGVSRRGIRD